MNKVYIGTVATLDVEVFYHWLDYYSDMVDDFFITLWGDSTEIDFARPSGHSTSKGCIHHFSLNPLKRPAPQKNENPVFCFLDVLVVFSNMVSCISVQYDRCGNENDTG